MGPRRKKSVPNGKAPAINNDDATGPPDTERFRSLNADNTSSSSTASMDLASSSKLTRQESGNRTNNDREDSASRKSWYGGSWKTKSPALVEIAKDGLAAASSTTLTLSKEASREKEDSESPAAKYMEAKLGAPRKSAPSAELEPLPNAEGGPARRMVSEKDTPDGKVCRITPEAPLPPDPSQTDGSAEDDKSHALETTIKDGAEEIRPVSGWFGWWSRPDGYQGEANKSARTSRATEAAVTEAQGTPLPESPTEGKVKYANNVEFVNTNAANGITFKSSGDPNVASQATPNDSEAPPGVNVIGGSKSWFGLWSKAENQKASSPPPQDGTVAEVPSTLTATASKDELNGRNRSLRGKDAEPSPGPTKPASKSSAWAFWSKEKPGEDEKARPDGTQKQIGEIAVVDTPSQSNPEVAQYNERKSPSIQEPTLKQNHRKREKQLTSVEPSRSTSSASPALRSSRASKSTDQLVELAAKEPGIKDQNTVGAKVDKSVQKCQRDEKSDVSINLLLPPLRATYPVYQPPSYWDQIRRLIFASSPRVGNTARHVDLLPTGEVPKIKKALAIGVHGYFPAQFLQMILGQPTGTSIRFANAAAAAIQRWAEEHQPSDSVPTLTDRDSGGPRKDSAKILRGQSSGIEIEKVALEGEGMVADRVDALWKLLLNWLPSISKADFIVVAAHSQGVPVAIQLVAKLLQFGCVKEKARVGICAMAGINMGPFAELKSRFLGGSAIELFEFAMSDSRVRANYEAALAHCLSKGVRISFIGSLDDQLVSLESSTFTPVTHPLIHRAVFVNSALHTSDFIPRLVGFALKLRNLGISDHGLIRELSGPLAGSLYTGDGHSKLYEDGTVFLRAVEFALETTGMETLSGEREVRLEREAAVRPSSSSASEIVKESAGANPYYLPWALRGVLEEPYVKEHMHEEVKELIGHFEKWKPTSKVLKDVRFRLEAVQSKL
ncbi:MAG: hypothetical protein M1822_002017 [Bathelium mastoideum]|nr:MAG: hypothetical protein M1822_002017 [Bathelium mastoideum]